jgi:hypothetical protein
VRAIDEKLIDSAASLCDVHFVGPSLVFFAARGGENSEEEPLAVDSHYVTRPLGNFRCLCCPLILR